MPVELVIDHSIQVDVFAERLAFQRNAELEFERNRERYAFLRWGQSGLRQLQGGAAQHRHLPPGEPRVPGARGGVARRPGVPRHARRHRLAHDDDQRARRARLGRRRHRGGGGDARPAGVDADPAGGRLQAHRRAARGLHRHRPRPHRHPDAARARRGRQVRGVLRRRAAQPAAGRPRHDREHVAGDGRHLRDLPGRRARRSATSSSPAAPPERVELVEAYCTRAGPLPRRGLRGGRPTRTRSSSTSARWSRRSPGRSARRTAWRSRTRPTDFRGRARRSTPGTRLLTGYDEAARESFPVERLRPPTTAAARSPRSATATRAGHRGGRARGGLRARLGGDRRDHELHEHLEPVGDARRRPAREEGRRGRARAHAVGQDLARAGLEGRDRLPRARRPDRAALAARLRPRRLRLHHLHRQLGPAARGRSRRRSRSATWWWPACCRATATSRAASTPR